MVEMEWTIFNWFSNVILWTRTHLQEEKTETSPGLIVFYLWKKNRFSSWKIYSIDSWAEIVEQSVKLVKVQ